MKKNLTLTAIILTLSSCAFGPKSEKKSKLNYLSGEHYKAPLVLSADGIPLPLTVRRIKKETTISGFCFYKTGKFELYTPIKFKEVTLKRGDKVAATGRCDLKGNFMIKEYLLNGYYTLHLQDGNRSANQPLHINRYLIKDVRLEAK